MKKFIIAISILFVLHLLIIQFVFVPFISDIILASIIPTLELKIDEEIRKQASELMRDEIIKQLKEKEGKTIEDYYIEDYFRRLYKEYK